jgi:prepilin peptidase CpaA
MLQQSSIWIVTLAVYCGLLLWAAVTDFRRYIIPNQASLGALALYPVYVLAAPHPVAWTTALIVAAVFFAIGFVLYMVRAMGAGDAKLLPVVVLWVGPSQLGTFVIWLAGATVLLALAIGLRSALAYTREEVAANAAGELAANGASRTMRVLGNFRRVQFLKLQMPYGVAIAAGGIAVAINAVFTVLR